MSRMRRILYILQPALPTNELLITGLHFFSRPVLIWCTLRKEDTSRLPPDSAWQKGVEDLVRFCFARPTEVDVVTWSVRLPNDHHDTVNVSLKSLAVYIPIKGGMISLTSTTDMLAVRTKLGACFYGYQHSEPALMFKGVEHRLKTWLPAIQKFEASKT